MIRVGFTLIGGKNWTGGYNYLLNLLTVLAEEKIDKVETVLFAGADVPSQELAPFLALPNCQVVQHAVFNERARFQLLLSALLLGKVVAVEKLIRQLGINVMFESAVFMGWRLSCTAIAWLPDLQQKYFPHLFSKFALLRREIGFRAQIMSGRMIMVSSEDTRRDCMRLYKIASSNIKAVRFAVKAPAPIDDEDARLIAQQYHLPTNFFFMPNQFWVHKNHRLVAEALVLLKSRSVDVSVVCSGQQSDPRSPGHVESLVAYIKAQGIDSNFIMLGMIPYKDLMPLMQASNALLNPSLFEGWSTTVEEARASGLPMILSNINVHKEQADDLAVYFDKSSSEALASCLSEFRPLSSTDRLARRLQATKDAHLNVKRFADDFYDLVQDANNKNKSS